MNVDNSNDWTSADGSVSLDPNAVLLDISYISDSADPSTADYWNSSAAIKDGRFIASYHIHSATHKSSGVTYDAHVHLYQLPDDRHLVRLSTRHSESLDVIDCQSFVHPTVDAARSFLHWVRAEYYEALYKTATSGAPVYPYRQPVTASFHVETVLPNFTGEILDIAA